ncbi:MAG TPA: Spo0B domain-containing protein [Desulfobacteria bacterium]|nr:Spo0B domain-containing protein [Desulfobacteria bacterium]
METSKEDYLPRLLTLYRLQRHDFLNDFQVAMGYIQLGKAEVAFEFLREAAAKSTARGALGRLATPELAVELLDLATACDGAEVSFSADIPENLPRVKWHSVYAEFFHFMRNHVAEVKRVGVSLADSGAAIRLTVHAGLLSTAGLAAWNEEIARVDIPGLDRTVIEGGLTLSFELEG